MDKQADIEAQNRRTMQEEDARRFAELGRMMNEMLRDMTPAEKDRMMQRHLAEAMTPDQKFKALGGMMNFVIRQLQARSGERADG